MTLLHNSIVYYKTIQHLTYLCYIFPLNPNQPIITIVHIQCKAYLNLRIYQNHFDLSRQSLLFLVKLYLPVCL